MNQDADVIPFPATEKPRPWSTWLNAISAVLMFSCLLWIVCGVLPEMRDISAQVQREREKEMERHKQFEDARRRHAIQAASLMVELERANEAAKRLNKSIARTE